MKVVSARRMAPWVALLLGSAWLSGCGGGGGGGSPGAGAVGAHTSTDPANTAGHAAEGAPPPATPEAPPVELMRNNSFEPGLASWQVVNAASVSSELRSGGRALRVSHSATQSVPSNTLVPGRAYKLSFTARSMPGGKTVVAVRFRKPKYSETFRTFRAVVTDTGYQTYEVSFTAPLYTAMVDVAVLGNGVPVLIDSMSLMGREPLPLTEPVTSTAGSHVPPGYRLAFNDEFEGTSLNRQKWFTRYIYGSETTDHLNDEWQRYRDNDNHRVENGVLSLIARRVSDNDPWGMNYESGMIRSDWTTRYGYFEARVKMPSAKGVWPAFWLNSDVSENGVLSWPPEIDIFEFVHNGVEDKLNMLHSGVIKSAGTTAPYLYTDPAFNTTWSYWWAPFNFNEDWHTIGAEWTPDSVTTYVDGKKLMTRAYSWVYADGSLAGPAHILLNLAIGGSWAGRHGVDRAAFPQAYQVDWVRAYKKEP